MRPYVLLFTVPLAGVSACSAPAVGPEDFVLPPGAPPPVVTDAVVYTLGHEAGGYVATALATYTNATGRPVYYRRCMPESSGAMYGVRRTGEDGVPTELLAGTA